MPEPLRSPLAGGPETTGKAAKRGRTTGIRRDQNHYNVGDFFCFSGQTDNNEHITAAEIRDPTCLEPHGLAKSLFPTGLQRSRSNFKNLFHLKDIAFLADDPPKRMLRVS